MMEAAWTEVGDLNGSIERLPSLAGAGVYTAASIAFAGGTLPLQHPVSQQKLGMVLHGQKR